MSKTSGSKWSKRWNHLLDLAASFNPFIDAARKHHAYLEGGGGMKTAWYRFSFFVTLIGIACFYGGCEVQKFLDRPIMDSKEKVVQWQPPEIATNASSISILIGGNLDHSGRVTGGSPLTFPIKFVEGFSNGLVIPIGNYKPIVVRIIKNRIYLDLSVPSTTNLIKITEGKSTPLPSDWDWNCNSNELEIVDSHLQSAFIETYVGNNFVWVQGAIQAGGQVLILNTDFNTYALYPNDCVPAGRFNVSDIELTTDFQYPSSQNYGKKIGE
jgi:hypothetical protein